MPVKARSLCAILAALSIAVLAGCQVPPPPAPVVPPPPPPPVAKLAPHQLTQDEPQFLRLANMDKTKTPLRIGVILPFTNSSPATRAIATGMLKAAQLALYDSGARDIVMMTADDSANRKRPITARRRSPPRPTRALR